MVRGALRKDVIVPGIGAMLRPLQRWRRSRGSPGTEQADPSRRSALR